ncbi:MAG TPA: tetratricopeptide repeat protein [Ktedonobacteraceae bacterium]|nr:tetratricopeptide repeat protein [Ktedonobacteraceae bacterium]
MTPKKDKAFDQYKILAEASLREALTIDNDYLGHMLLAGLLKENPDRLDDAANHLNQAKALTSNEDILLTIEYGLGEIAMEQAQYHKALQHFESVAAIDPTNAEAWYNIAEAHNLLEHVEEAEINYARAIALEPEIIDYFTALSRMHMEHGQALKARLVLEEGLRINPDSAQLRAFLALAVSESGDYRKAEELLDEAELLDPELDMVEMYRLLLNINKTRKLPAVNKTRQLPGARKTKKLPGLKSAKKRASKE